MRLWHAGGQRDRLDPLPVRVGFEVKFGVFGPDHAASSIVSKPKGRNQRRSLRKRARSCSRMIDERQALAPAAQSADTARTRCSIVELIARHCARTTIGRAHI